LPFLRVSELASATPEDQRDFFLLRSLRRALDSLAGSDFALAYNRSTNQQDYRWGKIHRLFIPHILGMQSEFSIPSQTGNFRSPFPGLFGIPRDGGYEVPNACSHPILAKNENDFIFRHSPTHRFGVVMRPGAIQAVDALAGGQSGNRQSPFYDDQLNFWLVCGVRPLISDKNSLPTNARTIYEPTK
jgi:penicillin G amidase